MDAPATYVKRPVPVPAIRWTGDNLAAVQDFAGEVIGPDGLRSRGFISTGPKDTYLWVAANTSWLPVEVGEWVLRDGHGCYPCKPDVFAATYAPQGAAALTGEALATLLAGAEGEHLGGMEYIWDRGDGEWVIDATIDLDAAAARITAALGLTQEPTDG